jgi:hypothetical protein
MLMSHSWDDISKERRCHVYLLASTAKPAINKLLFGNSFLGIFSTPLNLQVIALEFQIVAILVHSFLQNL